MRRCNSTGQGRSRILPRGRTIGGELEWCNCGLGGIFEWVCRGCSDCGRYSGLVMQAAEKYVAEIELRILCREFKGSNFT